MQDAELFSRETLAGYDRHVLDNAVVAIVGAGAAGNNLVLNLALSGVHEVRLIDDDSPEPSNFARSPLLKPERIRAGKRRFKAREVGLGFLSFSYSDSQVARYAISRIQPLGLGALAGCGCVISAVDSFQARAYLADSCRLLGTPLIELGFSGSHFHVTVFPNRSADEACFRCLHPGESADGLSCSVYARKVVDEGRTPATQPLAAVTAAIASEAAIRALHGEFPLASKLWHLDLRTGRSSLLALARDPACPGPHRIFGSPQAIEVRAADQVGKLFSALRGFCREPVIRLPSPYVVEMPCARCGCRVPIARVAREVKDIPECGSCSLEFPGAPVLPVVLTDLSPGDGLNQLRCKDVGLPPAAIFEVEDRTTSELHAVQLTGSVDDIFATLARNRRNGLKARGMDAVDEAAESAGKE